MTPDQRRFMSLHDLHHVTSWRWYFCETQLRAYTDRGRTATISRVDLVELVAWGFMTFGHGSADVQLTDTGRMAWQEKETA